MATVNIRNWLITLIKNSLDAFEENHIRGRYLTITMDQIDSSAIITITDNAGGISGEIMEQIFLPYFTTKGEENGTGLGLYMAKIVVEEHCRGILSVQSSQGNTTFTISLPVD
jgi:C4-dicarboxylate-specific signal transduction histidine kinase